MLKVIGMENKFLILVNRIKKDFIMKKQIKSKQRVTDYGEVFTGEREVNAMLDLVKDESERIESRFLEPACGTGNFVVAILQRKLNTVYRLYRQSHADYERYSIVAVSSIYGIDLLTDNVVECRKRLYDTWNEAYTTHCKEDADDECRKAAQYIIDKNILCGDALTMLKSDGTPIIFAQWDLVIGNKIKRRDYKLNELMRDDFTGPQMKLDLWTGQDNYEYDEEVNAWVPGPVKEYPLIDYREVSYVDKN